MNLIKFSNRTIKCSFYLLFFLVPLIMTPFNYELFEFNKMILVYALTTVIAAAWLIKMVVGKKILFRRTPLDIPILFFLISQFLSFFFSIDRHTSLWGYYGRFHGGLLSMVSYVTLYYALVSNNVEVLNCLRASLFSGFLVAGYGILEHFGIDDQYWVQDVRNRVFSTLGQPNWLAAYLAVISLLAWTFALSSKLPRGAGSCSAGTAQSSKLQLKTQNVKLQSSIFYLLSLSSIFYLCLLYTRSRSGFLGFWLANIVFLALLNLIPFIVREFKTKGLKEKKDENTNSYGDRHMSFNKINPRIIKKLVFVNLAFILITFFIGTPFEKVNRYFSWQGLTFSDILHTTYYIPNTSEGGTESGEIRKIVWQGAVDIWRHYPLFGSGVETFAYSYYQHRPKEHNLTSEWDFLYNKAHNEYLNYLATTGLVGLGGYLVFISAFVIWFFKISNFQFPISPKANQAPLISNQISILLIALFSGWLSILLTNFFGFSVVPVALFFFLLPAISLSLFSEGVYLNPPRGWVYIGTLGFRQKLAIAGVLIVTCYFLFVVGKLWFADVYYAKGRGLNQVAQYDLALTKLQAAISLNPGEPVYKEEMATSLAHLAFWAYQEEPRTLSDDLAQQAIRFNDQAIEISPYNLNFWKGRAKMFYTLSQTDKKYFENALTALTTAHMLAPTDAKVAYNLGLVLGQVGQNEQAIEMLEKTVELKPDYRNARYGLALFYHEADFDQAAIGQLEYILGNIATDDGEVIRKLEEIRYRGEGER